MGRKYILISLLSREKNTKDIGEHILNLFYENYDSLFPQYANFIEPINKPISTVDEALEYWEMDKGYYRRKNSPKSRWSIGTDWERIFFPIFKYDWNKKINWFALFQELVKFSRAYFGYLHLFTENEIKGAYVGSAVDCFLNGTPSTHLKKGIPQLGWGNYFGEEYVKEIDVDLFKKNGFEIQPLGEGYVFNITPQISDVITDYEAFDKRRILLKSLFRPGLFQKYETVDRDSDNDLARYIQSLESENNKEN